MDSNLSGSFHDRKAKRVGDTKCSDDDAECEQDENENFRQFHDESPRLLNSGARFVQAPCTAFASFAYRV